MIQPSEVMPLILEACPAFTPIWDEHFQYHYTGSNPLAYPTLHIDAGPLTRFIMQQLRADETACFPALFACLEQLL